MGEGGVIEAMGEGGVIKALAEANQKKGTWIVNIWINNRNHIGWWSKVIYSTIFTLTGVGLKATQRGSESNPGKAKLLT